MMFDLQCVTRGWTPTIGDPDPWGWSVVAAYGGAAALCLIACRRRPGRERTFWICAALLMAALGVNKQLDLQTLLTVTGRCLARAQGWYRERAEVQTAFVAAVTVIAVVATLTAAVVMRRHLARLWPAMLGLAAILAYVAVRAASFHHVDQLLFHRPLVAGIRADPILELAGAALIGINAVVRARGRGG